MSVVPELIMLSGMGKLLLCLGATSVKIEEEEKCTCIAFVHSAIKINEKEGLLKLLFDYLFSR